MNISEAVAYLLSTRQLTVTEQALRYYARRGEVGTHTCQANPRRGEWQFSRDELDQWPGPSPRGRRWPDKNRIAAKDPSV